MKDFQFPIFNTKIAEGRKFLLADPVQRKTYFEVKAGPQIKRIREYLEDGGTFVAFLLGKKNSGKGTYSKLFMEAVGGDRIAHVSVGDIVRSVHKDVSTPSGRKKLLDYLQKKYRGFVPFEKTIDVILGRDTKTLLPTEIILALVEREIDRLNRRAIFIDGFPRDLDQVSYSLYFRALVGYRDDPDFFVFIDVPEAVIHERMMYRVVCPVCQTPRNTRLFKTKQVGYDKKKKEFYLICDNPTCEPHRMVEKEGDELGIEVIRDRIEIDEKVMKMLLKLEGVPKIFLRNSIPVSKAEQFVDEYEITPSYHYEWDETQQKVRVIEKKWMIRDDRGASSYSLLAPPVALALIHQIAKHL